MLRTARAQRCLQTRLQTDNALKNSMFRGAASCADGSSPMMDWMVNVSGLRAGRDPVGHPHPDGPYRRTERQTIRTATAHTAVRTSSVCCVESLVMFR